MSQSRRRGYRIVGAGKSRFRAKIGAKRFLKVFVSATRMRFVGGAVILSAFVK
jgi:hypothetical protein